MAGWRRLAGLDRLELSAPCPVAPDPALAGVPARVILAMILSVTMAAPGAGPALPAQAVEEKASWGASERGARGEIL
jgi:hypothetical protein